MEILPPAGAAVSIQSTAPFAPDSTNFPAPFAPGGHKSSVWPTRAKQGFPPLNPRNNTPIIRTGRSRKEEDSPLPRLRRRREEAAQAGGLGAAGNVHSLESGRPGQLGRPDKNHNRKIVM